MTREQETAMYDQPDAMNEGEHIDVSDDLTGPVVCNCGAIVPVEEWEAHCESA